MATHSNLYKFRVFTLVDVIQQLDMTPTAASAALSRWQKKGIVKMVRRNLYTVVDPITSTPVADKYEIATNITATSYVGWHTALEFHGIAHQPFYNAYVGSKSRFCAFNFEDVDFDYCSTGIEPIEENGVIRPLGNAYVRVTNLERTIIDCCDNIERAGGIEELLHCLESVAVVNEDLLCKYLNLYNKSFLYQKVGYILERAKGQTAVSEAFIEMCRKMGAIHTKRISNIENCDSYVCRWKLYVPNYCLNEESKGYELI